LFAFETPAVAGEAAMFADDAMAGDDDGNGIGSAGAGDGANGLRAANAASDVGVGARLAGGDALEFFPDAALEGRAADVEGNLDAFGARTKAGDDGAGPGANAAGIFAEPGIGKIVGQLAKKLGIRLSEHDGADAARRGANQQAAERGIQQGVAYFEAASAAMVIAGSHAELGARAFIEPARGPISCVVDCFGHIASLPDTALEAAQAHRVRILPGRNAENAAKQTENPERSEAGLAGEGLKRGAAGIDGARRVARFEGLFDSAAEPVNQRAFGGAERDVAAEAARTRAIALAERVGGRGEKRDVAGRGTARRTARAAENSGGADGENETAVEGGITGGDGAPPGALRGAGAGVPRR